MTLLKKKVIQIIEVPTGAYCWPDIKTNPHSCEHLDNENFYRCERGFSDPTDDKTGIVKSPECAELPTLGVHDELND